MIIEALRMILLTWHGYLSLTIIILLTNYIQYSVGMRFAVNEGTEMSIGTINGPVDLSACYQVRTADIMIIYTAENCRSSQWDGNQSTVRQDITMAEPRSRLGLFGRTDMMRGHRPRTDWAATENLDEGARSREAAQTDGASTKQSWSEPTRQPS